MTNKEVQFLLITSTSSSSTTSSSYSSSNKLNKFNILPIFVGIELESMHIEIAVQLKAIEVNRSIQFAVEEWIYLL